jgi:hypothetical protein
MDIRTTGLIPESFRSRARYVETAFQMNGDDGVKFFLRHFVENSVAENTRVIDHAI